MAENEDKQDKSKKITVNVLTLSGDYNHKYTTNTLVGVVVADATKHLKLVTDGSWILQLNGQTVSQDLTLAEAGVQDGSELEFHAPEGGGGSRC